MATSPPAATDVAAADLMGLDPRVRTLWWCSAAIAALLVLLVVALVDLLAPLPPQRGVVTAVVAVMLAVLVWLVPTVRFNRWRYALRADDLWIRRGVVWTTTSVIPYARLQFVDTRQGPLDRVFGLAQLVVHTAAVGTSGNLPGLDAAAAERLRERLSKVEPDDTV
ncbi:MAG: PH domain-containing protein [Egibacteraceae bacterium]